MYVPTKDNPADHLSRGCSSKQLKLSNWLHGPSGLLTGEFPEQSNINVAVNELTVEINPVHPIPPLISDPRRGCYIVLSMFIFFSFFFSFFFFFFRHFCPGHISGTVTRRDSKLSVLLGPAV